MSDHTETATTPWPWTAHFDDEQKSAEWVTDQLWPNETIEEAALALCEEAGEVARAIIKRNHAEQGSGDRAPADWDAELRKELAQVVVVAMKMAEREGFSLIDAVLDELGDLDNRRIRRASGSSGDPA